MRDLPIAAQAYIILLSVVAALTTIFALRISLSTGSYLPHILLFAALICLAELSASVVQPPQVEFTVSASMAIAAVFLFPWPVAFLSQLLGTFLGAR